MPVKKEMDEHALFFYTCLKNHDGTKINFHAVGAALNVKQNTAYKRYASLVKAFEDTDEPEDKTGTAEAVTPKSTKPKKAVTKDGNAAGSKKRKNDDKATGRNKKTKINDQIIEEVAEKDIKAEHDAEEEEIEGLGNEAEEGV